MDEKVWRITFEKNGREYWTALRESTAESAVAQFIEWNKDAKVLTVKEM